jgi:hypothetical protein
MVGDGIADQVHNMFLDFPVAAVDRPWHHAAQVDGP